MCSKTRSENIVKMLIDRGNLLEKIGNTMQSRIQIISRMLDLLKSLVEINKKNMLLSIQCS